MALNIGPKDRVRNYSYTAYYHDPFTINQKYPSINTTIHEWNKQVNKGFSLIELLIVVAISTIIACMTYPSYQHYITRAHRIDGQSALFDLANRLELYYSIQNTYKTATINAGKTTDILSTNNSPEHWYLLSITHATDTTYTIQATPIAAQAISDKPCQSLTLNNLGVRGITVGPAGDPTGLAMRCW